MQPSIAEEPSPIVENVKTEFEEDGFIEKPLDEMQAEVAALEAALK